MAVIDDGVSTKRVMDPIFLVLNKSGCIVWRCSFLRTVNLALGNPHTRKYAYWYICWSWLTPRASALTSQGVCSCKMLLKLHIGTPGNPVGIFHCNKKCKCSKGWRETANYSNAHGHSFLRSVHGTILSYCCFYIRIILMREVRLIETANYYSFFHRFISLEYIFLHYCLLILFSLNFLHYTTQCCWLAAMMSEADSPRT